MYADASDMHFLDEEDYNQYSLPLADVEEEAKYLTERLEGVQILIYNDQAVGMQVPPTVELAITQCDPAVRGNSATGRTKPATLETGFVVQVPEYLSTGETIKVDSRTGEFLIARRNVASSLLPRFVRMPAVHRGSHRLAQPQHGVDVQLFGPCRGA